MYNESVCRHCYLTAEAQEGIVKIWWLELHYFQPYLCCLDLFSCLFQQIRSAFSFPGDILQCRNNSNRKWEPLDDPTGPKVKIDFFSSSEILNCWLFDSSCLRYLSCFFFMWNSCDTFRLDSKHRMQPETTRKQEVRVLFVWVAWTDRTAAHSSVWGGTNVWKSVSVLWVTWTSTLRNTIRRRRAKTDVIISTTSETYNRFNVMPFWR